MDLMKPILGAIGTFLLSAGALLGQTDYSNQNPPPDNKFRRSFFNFLSVSRERSDQRQSAQPDGANVPQPVNASAAPADAPPVPLPQSKAAFFHFLSLSREPADQKQAAEPDKTAYTQPGDAIPTPVQAPDPLPPSKEKFFNILSMSREPALPQSALPENDKPHWSFPRCCPKECIWGGGEYLLWWIKSGSTPPLVTLGNPSDPFPGSLGQPGTQIIYGGNGALDYGTFSGLRVTFGGWLDSDGVWGLEGNGFLLERRPTHFVAGSDNAGNPPIFLPFFRPDKGREGGFTISSPVILNPVPLPGFFTGTVSISSSSQLWGAGADGYWNLFRTCACSLDLLAGFRYLDLDENLSIVGTGLNDFPSGVHNSFFDSFDTRNQFYGGEFGCRLRYHYCRFSVDALAKLALGDNHEVVNINGAYTQLGAVLGPAQGTFPGGIFTQTSNIGRNSHDQFAVVPQVQLKAGYAILPRLAATVGYDFLYWNQAVRPGGQIDHSVNLSQSITQGNGVLMGPATPAPLFNRTDFFAHGVSFGLEFRY
jgi:hypothetical protein